MAYLLFITYSQLYICALEIANFIWTSRAFTSFLGKK